MAVAALIAWLVTAAGGFWMLGIWISRGGMSRGASRVLAAAGGPGAAGIAGGDLAERHLPVPVIIGHGVFAGVTLLLAALTAAGVS
jgi:hypothetical protein